MNQPEITNLALLDEYKEAIWSDEERVLGGDEMSDAVGQHTDHCNPDPCYTYHLPHRALRES